MTVNEGTVSTLSTDTARTYRHVHPLLILAVFYVRFDALVEAPVRALASLLPVVVALQLSYAVLCLPAAGGAPTPSPSTTAPASTSSPSTARGRKKPVKPRGNDRAKVAALATALTFTLGLPAFFGLTILFGAPVTTHIPHTLLLSAHIAALALLPLVYVHGVDGSAWRRVIAALTPLDEVYGGTVGALLGAWLGAVPIPLDWDREWQKWPVTIVTGAYVGYLLGKLLGGTLMKGWKIKFE